MTRSEVVGADSVRLDGLEEELRIMQSVVETKNSIMEEF